MTKDIDWKNLGFAYMDTNGYVKASYRDGKWGAVEVHTDPMINIHISATALHYGQSCFEGLKVFSDKEGNVSCFHPRENAARMQRTAERTMMIAPPTELFLEAITKVVQVNKEFVPPHGTGASLYVRPLLMGASPIIGLSPSTEYDFYVLVTPVGPYYKNGFFPVNAYVQDAYDRSAPRGVGHVKVAGNYAASLMPDSLVREKGFPITLYLDAKHNKYVDEFGTSNFIGITEDKKYKTPSSHSILPSITNKSLQILAQDMGYEIVKEDIAIDSVEQFSEVGACGTAAVITPIASITHGEKKYSFGNPDKAGDTLTALFKELQGIMYGDIDDRHNWMFRID